MAEIKTKKEFDDYEEDLPENIFKEFQLGKDFKGALGTAGLYEQTRINEKFMLGEQWDGAEVGDMPTPVMNIIKQIIDYKIANLTSNPIEFMFSFEGVPCYLESKDKLDVGRVQQTLEAANMTDLMGNQPVPVQPEDEFNAVADAMSAHCRTIWERTQMDRKNQTGARKAAISGTYVLYCPFDADIMTGLYSSDGKTPIKGDISPQILDITNVYFGNPAETDVQAQPSIIISQRKGVREVARLAKLNNVKATDIEKILEDTDTGYDAGNIDEDAKLLKKTTLLTKFWKEYQADGTYKVNCVKCVKDVVIQETFDIGIQLYPLAVFQWDERDNCIYGHSEVTELIPNQTCVNRLLALEILATMLVGMPKTIFNGEVIDGSQITNDPGDLIEVRSAQDVHNAIAYLNPAQVSPNFNNIQQGMIDNTKVIAGATQAALGDLRPENTSAIIALREAATLPLQPVLMRFHSFVEDVARIWGEMILKKYGERKLKIKKDGKVYYVPFDADKYTKMLLSVKIEVGTSTLWSVSTLIATLNNLLMLGKIDIVDFLERVPDGFIPKRQDLINSLKARMEQAQQMAMMQAQPQGANPTETPTESPPDINNILASLEDEPNADELMAALQENPDILESVMQNANGGGAQTA